MIIEPMNLKKIYTSKSYGDFKIKEYINCGDVVIEFIETGFTVSVQSSQIKRGSVKDKLVPSVFGVGFIGDGKYKSREDGIKASNIINTTNKEYVTHPTHVLAVIDRMCLSNPDYDG